MSEIIQQRIDKLKKLKSQGINPYSGKFRKTSPISEILTDFQEGREASVAGRLVALRGHGKSVFADLKDGSGKIQIYLKAEGVGEKSFDLFEKVDIADFIRVSGELFKTRTGEASIRVKEWTFLAKTLRPLPEKWHGLKDIETRYRQRYLDLIMNEEVRGVFLLRSRIIKAIRDFLDERGFLEVETPILQPLAGGAAARPFQTHHKALASDLYLRIAPELYLKRLLVGGVDKVYELNKSFRNEGLSVRHNPEFTMLEVYQAYCGYEEVMELAEELISSIARQVKGGTERIEYQGKRIELKRPWKRIKFYEALKKFSGTDFEKIKDEKEMRKVAKELDLTIAGVLNRASILDAVLKKKVAPALLLPTFVIDYPKELSPLAKSRKDTPDIVERFQLFIGGLEVANAFSELNDPGEQRERFLEQQRLRKKGDEEAHSLDEDFLLALEHGMPPAGGLGIGVDRLVMVLTNQTSIRDVIFFPQLRLEK